MRRQLDILALEPFYGGVRRAMLTALMRYSRHRWTLLKLPPRRMERRLSAAANWFAEQLSRHFSGHVDVLFTSDAMNLASLLRLDPELAARPSVVYFHENRLPELDSQGHGPFDLVNLNTATTASEIWFNSSWHLRTFLMRAASLVARHPELAALDPIPAIAAKALQIPFPMDLGVVQEVQAFRPTSRDPDAIFVETRDADIDLLNRALELLHRQGRGFRLITVGPAEGLADQWPRHTHRESDEFSQVLGMLESTSFLSAKRFAPSDYLFMRAMLAGCRPVVPNDGVYPELIPEPMHEACLHENDPLDVADKLAEALLENAGPHLPDWRRVFRSFDAIPACRTIDQRLTDLAAAARPPAETPVAVSAGKAD